MTFSPGDIVFADLGFVALGYEQVGARPAIFLHAEGGVSLIIPLTSNMARLRFAGTVRINPDHTNGLASPSVALAFQMRATDSRRLRYRIGKLSAQDARNVNKVIRSIALIS